MLWVAIHFPCLPPQALAPIAAWACQFTPKVSLEPPQELVLEVEGSLRLFGGFASFKKRLTDELAHLGYAFSLAAEATPRAALWRARGEGRDLDALPVEVTRFDIEFLRGVGIATLGELLRLPRAGLGQRCGARMLEELDWALGATPEARAFFAPPPRFDAKLELPAQVEHAEGLFFGAQRLLVQLAGLLAARHEGIRAFKLFLLHEQKTTTLEIGLASATRDVTRFAQVLRERLARLSLAEPVSAIRVEAEHFAALAGASAGMFGDPAGESEDWARLLERLRARLGHAAVYGLAVEPDHRPEHASRRVEPGEWDPRDWRAPGLRPLWLVEKRKLHEGEFTPLVGPERIESGWWDGDDARRDYFIARLADGALGWVYREDGLSSPSWYLHGLFA